MRYIITSTLATLGFALPAATALAAVPQVVTDIPPVQSLVAQVMGDLGTPVLLLEKGADEHDFQLRPSQMGAIADADLVVWIGPELTPWLDRAMPASKGVSLPLLAAKGTTLRPYAPEEHDEHEDHEAHEEHADEAAEAGGEHDHDHSGTDPHAWLDPGNAAVWLDVIAAELSQLDPENAATYAGNAETAKAEIAATDADLAAQMADITDKGFVTFHAAYGYFTAHYGLTGAASLALGDAAAPGAAKLRALQTEMQEGAYDCAFPEIQHDPALLTQVMEGSATRLGAALDPVGSGLEPGPQAYTALLTGIATALVACLGQ